MSLTPLTFTGVSTFSNDLQTILTRAVNIAKLPLTRLQNADADVLQKKTLLGAMQQPLTSLGNAVKALGTIATNRAVGATSSNTAKVAINSSNASAATVYTISEVTSLAAAANETSAISYPDSNQTTVSANGSMRLVVGTQNFDFTLTNNTLAGLRDKINLLGAGVSASILTTAGDKNYLSVSASATGATTLKLADDPEGTNSDLLTAANQGSNVEFKLNGIPVSRSSNVVNDVVAGVSFSILDKTAADETVKITLATDRTQLSSAINDFVSSYNTVVGQVSQQIGANAGLLSGDVLIGQIRNDLRSLSGYQASGTVKSLAEVGIEFDSTGKISFDSTKFGALADSQITGAFDFFGSSTTGFGALAKKFTQLSDPVDGLIKMQMDGYDVTDRRLQSEIADKTDRIEAMQKAVAARLQVADALLAGLQSQQSAITASIQSMNYAIYGKTTSN